MNPGVSKCSRRDFMESFSTVKKRIVYLSIIFFSFIPKQVSGQDFNHNLFWFRLVFADKFNERWRWETYLQSRTQNGMKSKANMFEANHMQNLWIWFSYKATDHLKVNISPVGIFRSSMYIASSTEQDQEPVNEYRISLRLDQESKYSRFTYSTRVGVESRWREIYRDDQYHQNFRFRYVARVDVPLFKKSDGTSRFTFTVYNETMLQAGPAVRNFPNVFDQNRVYTGGATNVSPNIKFNLGYIFMIQQRLNGKDFDKGHTIWAILTFDNLFSGFRKAKS